MEYESGDEDFTRYIRPGAGGSATHSASKWRNIKTFIRTFTETKSYKIQPTKAWKWWCQKYLYSNIYTVLNQNSTHN